MRVLGDLLEALCNEAEREVVLVAPFIKTESLRHLITNLKSDVELHCVTRWRPEEIVAGVSDLEVWCLLREREKSALWLRTDLHAKYYRADDAPCLVGSANLTQSALGWSMQPNLEILVPIPQLSLANFELQLFSGCIKVNEMLYRHMQTVVAQMPDIVRLPSHLPLPTLDLTEGTARVPLEAWIPTLRHPANLFLAYSGQLDTLGSASQRAALLDLDALQIPPMLEKKAFEQYVGAMLLQKPIIQAIDEFVVIARRFGAVTNLLSHLPCHQNTDFNATYAWQTLMRWLLFFLPSTYQVWIPRHSEVFGKIPLTTSKL